MGGIEWVGVGQVGVGEESFIHSFIHSLIDCDVCSTCWAVG